MQSAELSVRDVKEALVREASVASYLPKCSVFMRWHDFPLPWLPLQRNAQLAAEIAVRLHVLQQTGQRLELDRVGRSHGA